jgi:hypothetical protein
MAGLSEEHTEFLTFLDFHDVDIGIETNLDQYFNKYCSFINYKNTPENQNLSYTRAFV